MLFRSGIFCCYQEPEIILQQAKEKSKSSGVSFDSFSPLSSDSVFQYDKMERFDNNSEKRFYVPRVYDCRKTSLQEICPFIRASAETEELDIIIIESLRLIDSTTMKVDKEIVSTLEKLSQKTNCCVFVLPIGATFELGDFDESEVAQKEFLCTEEISNQVQRWMKFEFVSNKNIVKETDFSHIVTLEESKIISSVSQDIIEMYIGGIYFPNIYLENIERISIALRSPNDKFPKEFVEKFICSG